MPHDNRRRANTDEREVGAYVSAGAGQRWRVGALANGVVRVTATKAAGATRGPESATLVAADGNGVADSAWLTDATLESARRGLAVD